jgi:uncharacterized protein (TIGR02996 family)
VSDRRAELEAAIEAAPDEAGNYLVLADVLQQLGDPRGEAIVRWHGGTRGVRTEVETKLGPVPPKFSQLEWFCGYVKRFRVYVDDEDPGAFHTFFGHPSMRFIQDIDLDIPGGRYAEDRQWLVEYLGRDKHPTVRSLTLNSYQRGGNQPPIGDFDLTPLWTAFPRLQSLIVNARYIDPGPLTSTTVTSLTFDGEVTANAMQPLLDGSMPALQELVLWDVGVDFLERFAGSALEKQLTKVDLHPHNFDEDRYEQTGE